MIVVDSTGALALLADLGRQGLAHLGVSPSGAADRGAHRLANRMVGNPETAATIECVLGGLRIRSQDWHWVAVTGAPTSVLVRGRTASSHTSIALHPGDTLAIEPPQHGLRSYLAVRGGLAVPASLGSRSTDVLSGLGPQPLVAGQRLAVGRADAPLPDSDLVAPRLPSTVLELLPGPRRDWFTDPGWHTLLSTGWRVSNDSNRTAVRLDGPRVERARGHELPSEAMVRGAIQVPSSGQPLIFGPDHPVTGGYPVIAVLTEQACDHAAQLRPGDTVRFRLARG